MVAWRVGFCYPPRPWRQDFSAACGLGIARGGRELGQLMAYGSYAGLNEADLADIVAYLRTVPPLQ